MGVIFWDKTNKCIIDVLMRHIVIENLENTIGNIGTNHVSNFLIE